MSKGNIVLIISIIVAVLFFVATAGFVIWKVVDSEESSRSDRSSSKDSSEEIKDCGTSVVFLEEQPADIFSLDFEKDQALVCLGKNIENSCKESQAVIKIDDLDLTYKVVKKDVCWIYVEFYEDGGLNYVTCPMPQVYYYSVDYYPEVEEYFSGSPGSLAATYLIMTMYLIDDNYEKAISFGCESSEDNSRIDNYIKADMSSLRAAAEIYSYDSGDYLGFCQSQDYLNIKTSIEKNGSIIKCKDLTDKWIVCSSLSDVNYCVDYQINVVETKDSCDQLINNLSCQ